MAFKPQQITFALAAITASGLAMGVDTPTTETLDGMYYQEIDQATVDMVRDALPERVVNEDFIDPDYDGYLNLNTDSKVSISFIHEGAGFTNSTGYFTFSDTSFDGLTKADIDTDNSGWVSLSELDAVEGVDYNWMFPNTSFDGYGGTLQTGDTIDINVSADQNLAFFLGQNSWTGETVNNNIIDGRSGAFYSLDFLNPESWSQTNIDSTGEAPRWYPDGIGYGEDGAFTHTALLTTTANQDEVVLGFEDLRYGGDKDYNDAVFLITAEAANAFGDSNIAVAPVPLMSGGMLGLLGTLGIMFAGGRRRA